MIQLMILMISPAWWVLIGAIVLPIVVFGTLHLSTRGYFERFKRKKK
jgi:hypothetical protein